MDGTSLGCPKTCILANDHVLPDKNAARNATVRFNYESDDPRQWLEMKLDPDRRFVGLEKEEIGFCLVACSTIMADLISRAIEKGIVSPGSARNKEGCYRVDASQR